MTAPSTTDRRAVMAIAATFGVNACVMGSLLPRFPEIADRVDAGEAAFGVALLAGGLGGFLGSVATTRVVAAVGGLRAAIRWSVPVMLLGGVLAASAPTLPLFGVALAVVGLADGVLDPSMNELAMGEQRRRGRSIMGRMHATWSATMTASVGIGAVMAALGVPTWLHLLVAVALLGVVQCIAQAHLRDEDAGIRQRAARRGGGRAPRRLAGGTIAIVVLGIAAAWVETPPQDWSGLLLARDLGVSDGLAGVGPFTFVAGVLAGRLLMDPAVDRVGGACVAWTAGLMSVLGMGGGLILAAGTGQIWPLLVGLVLAGVGASPVFPLMFTAADEAARRRGRPAGTGGSMVSAASRVGFLTAPLIVGTVAERSGLLVALAITPVGAVLMVLTLPRLIRATSTSPTPLE